MGLFLAMSGVVGGSAPAVVDALRAYARDNAGTMEEAAQSADDCLSIATAPGGVTALYPDSFLGWDDASKVLSERLGKLVFSFHIHDGDLWMYRLYENGAVVDRFNPVPDYWGTIDSAERRGWRGDAASVASRIPGLSSEQIAGYLVQWDDLVLPFWRRLATLLGRTPRKAYATDRFHYGQDWQLIDFMDKLGLAFPDGDWPRATYRFTCSGRPEML
jgi:hypothetical protein